MDEKYEFQASWRYRRVKQAWYHKKYHPFTKDDYNLKFAKDSVMSWISWSEWIGIAFLETKYQDHGDIGE